MKQLLVFVEGDADEKIVNSMGFGSALIVRQGPGKKGLKAYMQGYANSSRALRATNYVGFRDRDFDYEVPETAELIIPQNDKGRILVTYRTTIENYLLIPENYQHFLAADQSKKYPTITVAEFSDALREAARDIRYFQAARHALGATRKENPLETSWLASSGKLPDSLSRDACEAAAVGQLQQYGEKASSIADQAAFRGRFESFCEKFNDRFFQGDQYQIWFQGKDLATRFAQNISAAIPNFPWKSFYKVAIDHFDYTLFPDLVQLRRHLERLTQDENT